MLEPHLLTLMSYFRPGVVLFRLVRRIGSMIWLL